MFPQPFNYQIKSDWPPDLLTVDLEKIFDAFDIIFRQIWNESEEFQTLWNAEEIDVNLLDAYLLSKGWRIAVDFPGVLLTETEKRKLGALAVAVYRQKGTKVGIVNLIRLLLGIESAVLNEYNVDVWILGESELGVDTNLFFDEASQEFALYSFDIKLVDPVTPEEILKIRAIANYMKPAHTHLINVVQPVPPVTPWILGESELGVETDLN